VAEGIGPEFKPQYCQKKKKRKKKKRLHHGVFEGYFKEGNC
jgi:hypothetical protein